MRLRPPFGMSLAAVALLAAALLPAFQRARGPVGLAVVADAVGVPRPVEARLGGLGGHAPWPVEGAARGLPPRLRRQLRDWDAAAADGSPTGLQLLAGVRLLGGRAEDAVDLLERAAVGAPEEASAWTDLAAALLERAREPDHRYDAVRALAAAERAVALDASSLAARFNLALALSRLRLRSQAIRAWEDYLDVEHDPNWRAEADRRLAALARPTVGERWVEARRRLTAGAYAGRHDEVAAVVSRYPRASRELALDELLPAWAEAAATWNGLGEPPPLRAAGAVGAALVQATGDAAAADAVAAVRAALADPAGWRRAEDLAAGHLAYREARRLYGEQSYGSARERSAEAERLLSSGGSPVAGWAALQVAICDYYLEEYETARRSLADVRALPAIDAERYPGLAAELLWMEGLTDHVTARPGAALDRFEQALRLYRRTGDREGTAAIHAFTAGVYGFLGAEREAWRHRHSALSGLDQYRATRRVVSLLGGAAGAVAREDASAALRFQSEAVAIAEAGGVPLERVVARLARARLRSSGPDRHGAERDLAAARGAAGEIDDPELRAAADAEIDLAEASFLLAAENAAGAESAAARAAIYFEAKGKDLYAVDALAALARAAALGGRPDDEERHLRRAIEIIETHRQRVLAEPLRISLFDRPSHQRIYDRLIEILALERGRPIEALAVVERSRARALLDRLGEKKGHPEMARFNRPLTPAEIQRELPEGTALVVFSVLERATLAWVVTRERIAFEPLSSGDDVATAADTLAESEVAAGYEALEALVSPLVPHLDDADSIYVMPDERLRSVPLAASLAQRTSSDRQSSPEVAMTPSGTVLARALVALRQLAGRPATRALVIGDPMVDRLLFPSLPALAGARREAVEVGALYSERDLLIGPEATRESFLKLAASADVIHIASHAVVIQDRPELTTLVLGSAAGDLSRGAVYASEIAALDLTGVRLVVLGGCGTTRGIASLSEGVLSLARSFLAAGVPTVLGTLRRIDDENTDLVSFHRTGRLAETTKTDLIVVGASPTPWKQEGGRPRP